MARAEPAEGSGAAYLLALLADAGIDTIFGYPGGAVLPLYDALARQDRIRHVLVRHEQAAIHAAEGYARASGRIGVALVTSGPGATNTITGLTDALMDSVPVLCIAGQVNRALLGTDGFQEANTIALSRAATKYNVAVRRPGELGPMLRRCLHLATAGRPGPVLIDLPKDVQAMVAPDHVFEDEIAALTVRPVPSPDLALIAQVAALLAEARRPLIYSGGGVINSGPRAAALLRRFAQATGAPVTSTLMGLGAFPASDPQWLGMPGMHGTYEANLAMHGCDLMLCVGARFDDRVTGRVADFAPHAKKVHIDVDPSEIGKIVAVDVGVVGDAADVLDALCDAVAPPAPGALDGWWATIGEWRGAECLAYEQPATGAILPQHAIRRLHELTHRREPIISTEVGQHQMWAAQHVGFDAPNRWLTSGGLGTMGYGLPAAIGAQIAFPGALVIDIAGEASVQMNIQELATAVQYGLPVKLFILNNGHMGMVRQWQQLHHGGVYSESVSTVLPDFVRLAEAYGWTGLRIEEVVDLDAGILRMIDTPGPVLVDCRVAPLANCYPMMPSGAAHNEILLG
ncbi:acetolactate synthase [Sphingomonas sp. SRS2]|nr:acetolactate synthase [Sphingomonas sp. SRS2]